MEVTIERTVLRQIGYRLFGALFLYPKKDRLDIVMRGAEWLESGLSEEDRTWLFGDSSLTGDLAKGIRLMQEDLESFQADWVRLFGVSRSGHCNPYEGAYLTPEEAHAVRTRLERVCAQVGLTLSVDELPDHAAVQFEFMSFLSGRLMSSLGRDAEGSDAILAHQQEFLRSHLGKWFSPFSECVMSNSGGFYSLVCQLAAELIERDIERFGSAAVAERPESVAPSVVQA